MTRRSGFPFFSACSPYFPLFAQSHQHPATKHDSTPAASAQKQQPPDEDNPPEEDEEQKPEQYAFNPLKAKQVLDIGMFYMHKSQYKGAAGRFSKRRNGIPDGQKRTSGSAKHRRSLAALKMRKSRLPK